jgi:hypothetical protein
MLTENSGVLPCLSTTLPSPRRPDGAQASEPIIREWILRFATNAGQVLNDGQVILWVEEFSDVEAGILQIAFRAALRSHVFSNIPTVGEVWTQIDEARRTERLAQERIDRQRWLSNQPSDEELHRRGLEYCAQMGEHTAECQTLREKPERRIDSEPVVIAWPERLAELEAQKRIVLAKYGTENLKADSE